ncbi:MAG: HAMP domain-containing sensor histidine kinase [Pseudomonadota bacterium]
MSSVSASSVFASRTFRGALRWLGLAMVAAGLVIALLALRHALDLSEAQRGQINERLGELVEQLEEDGLPQVIDDYSDEYGPLWPTSEAHYLLEEGEVLLLVMQGDTPVLGFAALSVPVGWSEVDMRVPGEEIPLETQVFDVNRVELNPDISVVGALPQLDIADELSERFGTVLLLYLLVCAAAVVACFYTSRYVLVRMSELSAAVADIAAGDLNARAAMTPANDEFDRVASDINRMLEQIRALMRNLEEISVGAAHDLKTPLTRLDQRLQRILHDAADPTEVRVHATAAHEHVQTLLTTFNALLRLGEIESGRLRTNFERIDLSALVSDVAEAFDAVFIEQQRSLQVSVMPGIEVSGDRDLIAQQISNLFENILEHTDPPCGGWVRLQSHTDGALLQIGDHGPGIPEGEQDRVFERFYRIDKSRSKPGNGLGLSLVASIANVHGAAVALHPRSQGTVIDITFPQT